MVTMKSLLVLNGSTDTLSPWGQHMPSATMYVKKTIVFDTRRSLLRIALTYVTKELWRRRSMFLINHPCATAPMFCIFDPAYTSQSRWALHTIIKIPACGVPDAILGAFLAAIPEKILFFFKAVHLMGNPTQCANHHVYGISFPAYVPLARM